MVYCLPYDNLFKKQICAGSDLLLNISLVGGQSLKWINHEREVRSIHLQLIYIHLQLIYITTSDILSNKS